MNRKKFNLMIKILILLAIVLIAAISIIFIAKNKIDKYEEQINDYVYEIESNRQIVYVVKDGMEIKKGEALIAEGENANVMRQEIYSGLEPGYYVEDEDIGSVAVIDIPTGQPIMKNMITNLYITHDTREYEIGVVSLMVDQQVHDYIDIRIMYPNGEDYLILSKKQINKMVMDSSLIYCYMNEEEILRLASATVDAYTMTGAKIYATRYVESNLQNEAKPDYLVSASTMDRMVSDPNIVTLAQETMNLQARMDLEKRLSGLTEEQLAAVAEGHGIADTAKTAILTNGVQFKLTPEEQAEADALESEENADMEEETDGTPGIPTASDDSQKDSKKDNQKETDTQNDGGLSDTEAALSQLQDMRNQ